LIKIVLAALTWPIRRNSSFVMPPARGCTGCFRRLGYMWCQSQDLHSRLTRRALTG
jgi:hypothetical protein